MSQMQHFLLSSSVGKQRVIEPSYSEEKLRIQNIVEALCPRLRGCKVILQETIWSLTPGRRCKKMTHALAERAVEVTSNISHLLEGAEETPQLIDNIIKLEQTLRDICEFVQSKTQQNLLLRIFAKNLRVRYFSLDRQLRGLLKSFDSEQRPVKKPLVSCAVSLSTTIQEHHSVVDGALAVIVPPNNSSATHASGSFFQNANNFVVQDGAFYNLVVKNSDRTPQGIVEGADVFTSGDVLPKKEIYKGRGYRVYSAHSTAKARAVKIKLYEGRAAKDRCLAAASFSQKAMHPNVLHLIGVSPLNSELPFLVFDESTEWAIESIIASALSKGLKQSLILGLQTVVGLSSGLDYLHTLSYPFASLGLDHFVVSSSHGNIVIGFDPEVLADETRERDQPSDASDGGNELNIFHGLCQRTFDAACKAHYEFQKVQRSDFDELDADRDLDQDRFEEIEVDAGTLLEDTKGPISNASSSAPSAPQPHAALPDASSMSSISPRRQFRKSSPSAHRRELVWRSQKNEMVSLEEIARQFQSFLLTFSTELGFNHRRGRYTTKTAHRCPGYNRIEITLTPDISRSAVVSHLTPIPHEICPVCKEIVKDAEIFACICGRDDSESIPTMRCSTCSEWHHRPCVSISENEDQSFVCQRCKNMRKKQLGKGRTPDAPSGAYSVYSLDSKSESYPFASSSGPSLGTMLRRGLRNDNGVVTSGMVFGKALSDTFASPSEPSLGTMLRGGLRNKNGVVFGKALSDTFAASSGPFASSSGPSLGIMLRGELRNKDGVVTGGVVFGKALMIVTRETGINVRKEMRLGGGVEKDGLVLELEKRLLPAIVVRCAQHLLIWGVQEEGVFRVSGRPSHVSKLRSEFDRGVDYDMTECSPGDLDPHAVASVFKAYLRELPESILTSTLSPLFDAAIKKEVSTNLNSPEANRSSGAMGKSGLPQGPKGEFTVRKPPSLSTLSMPTFSGMPPPSTSLVAEIKSLVSKLPQENYDLLRTVVDLVKATGKESTKTKMPLSNLMLVFCPNLNVPPPLLRVFCEAEDIWEEV